MRVLSHLPITTAKILMSSLSQHPILIHLLVCVIHRLA
jgi:hypothetical protein